MKVILRGWTRNPSTRWLLRLLTHELLLDRDASLSVEPDWRGQPQHQAEAADRDAELRRAQRFGADLLRQWPAVADRRDVANDGAGCRRAKCDRSIRQ